MKHVIMALVASVLVSISPAISYSQEGSTDLPSISTEAKHVFIANRTNGEIVFYLESKNTDRTEFRLEPGKSATYRGIGDDSWLNIYVYSKNTHVVYCLDVGSRYHLKWNSDGILDVYRTPPN